MAGLILCGQAVGADWMEIHRDDEGISYIDVQSIQKSTHKGKAIVGAWDKVEFYKGRWTGNKYAHISTGFGWFNCQDKTMSNIVNWIAYDKQGNLLKQESQAIKQFEYIEADTYGEELWDMACTQALIKDFVAAGGADMTERQFNQLSKQYPEQIDNFMRYLEYLANEQ